jgi:DNA-binding transcriptional LysR family regulator
MELRQLEYFTAVAAGLNFSRAAQRIHVVQSALSAAVAKLEKELGVALFDRSKRQIVLTAAGEVFLDHARAAIHAARRAQSSVEDYRAQLTGTVTLGIVDVDIVYRFRSAAIHQPRGLRARRHPDRSRRPLMCK